MDLDVCIDCGPTLGEILLPGGSAALFLVAAIALYRTGRGGKATKAGAAVLFAVSVFAFWRTVELFYRGW